MVQPLWHNHKIKLENKPLFYSKISEHNKHFVSDIIHNNGKLVNWSNANIPKSKFLNWLSLVHAIPCKWVSTLKSQFDGLSYPSGQEYILRKGNKV